MLPEVDCMAQQHPPRFLKIVEEVKQRVRETNVDEIKARLDRHEKFVLVDVREDHEYDKDHLPGAVHLGKGIIERDIEGKYPDLATPLVLYCGGGFRSALAADNLQRWAIPTYFRWTAELATGARESVSAGVQKSPQVENQGLTKGHRPSPSTECTSAPRRIALWSTSEKYPPFPPMSYIGSFALILALSLSSYSFLAGLLALFGRDAGSMRLGETARRAGIAAFGAVLLAAVVLVTTAFRDDFSISYIIHHSNRDLPAAYKFAVLWSDRRILLFWSLLLGGYGFVLRLRYKTNGYSLTLRSDRGSAGFLPDALNFAAHPFGIVEGALRRTAMD
jgi:rhodanese-related sulfurtransferase